MNAPSIIAAFALIGGLACTSRAQAVDVCNPAQLQGAYGFQLSGRTTISGTSKPFTSVGRLIFDGHGVLSGEASANFAGYFLGNPVTGKYEAHTDCTITWSLQDDSGFRQPFAGTLTPDLLSATFHQSDATGPQNGTMQKVAEKCSATSLAQRYTFSLSGNVIPMIPPAMCRAAFPPPEPRSPMPPARSN